MREDINYRANIDTSDLAQQLQQVKLQIDQALATQTFQATMPDPGPMSSMGRFVQPFDSVSNAAGMIGDNTSTVLNSARYGFQKMNNDVHTAANATGIFQPRFQPAMGERFMPDIQSMGPYKSLWEATTGFGYDPKMSMLPGEYNRYAETHFKDNSLRAASDIATGVGIGGMVAGGAAYFGAGTLSAGTIAGLGTIAAVASPIALAGLAYDVGMATFGHDFETANEMRPYIRDSSWRFLSGRMDNNAAGRIAIEASAMQRSEKLVGQRISSGDVQNLISEFTQIGGFDMVRTAEEYRDKLKMLVENHQKVLQTLKVSSQEATAAIKSWDSMGLVGPQASPAALSNIIAATAYNAGYTPAEFMQFGVQSAEAVRGTGIMMGSAYLGGMEALGVVKNMMSTGFINNELAAQLGGAAGMAQMIQSAGTAFGMSKQGLINFAAEDYYGKNKSLFGRSLGDVLSGAINQIKSPGEFLEAEGEQTDRVSNSDPSLLFAEQGFQYLQKMEALGLKNINRNMFRGYLKQQGINAPQADLYFNSMGAAFYGQFGEAAGVAGTLDRQVVDSVPGIIPVIKDEIGNWFADKLNLQGNARGLNGMQNKIGDLVSLISRKINYGINGVQIQDNSPITEMMKDRGTLEVMRQGFSSSMPSAPEGSNALGSLDPEQLKEAERMMAAGVLLDYKDKNSPSDIRSIGQRARALQDFKETGAYANLLNARTDNLGFTNNYGFGLLPEGSKLGTIEETFKRQSSVAIGITSGITGQVLKSAISALGGGALIPVPGPGGMMQIAPKKNTLELVTPIAERLGIEPEWLDKIIYHESKWDPTARLKEHKKNKDGKDILVETNAGLIQFGVDASKDLGLTQDEIAQKTIPEQLVLVEKYLSKFKGGMNSLKDVSSAIFYGNLRKDYKLSDEALARNGSIKNVDDYIEKMEKDYAAKPKDMAVAPAKWSSEKQFELRRQVLQTEAELETDPVIKKQALDYLNAMGTDAKAWASSPASSDSMQTEFIIDKARQLSVKVKDPKLQEQMKKFTTDIPTSLALETATRGRTMDSDYGDLDKVASLGISKSDRAYLDGIRYNFKTTLNDTFGNIVSGAIYKYETAGNLFSFGKNRYDLSTLGYENNKTEGIDAAEFLYRDVQTAMGKGDVGKTTFMDKIMKAIPDDPHKAEIAADVWRSATAAIRSNKTLLAADAQGISAIIADEMYSPGRDNYRRTVIEKLLPLAKDKEAFLSGIEASSSTAAIAIHDLVKGLDPDQYKEFTKAMTDTIGPMSTGRLGQFSAKQYKLRQEISEHEEVKKTMDLSSAMKAMQTSLKTMVADGTVKSGGFMGADANQSALSLMQATAAAQTNQKISDMVTMMQRQGINVRVVGYGQGK